MLENDPLWYKDAIIYQLHVRSFHDGLGDGLGDFKGLTEKIGYLEDLGVTAIWVLPFYPSPWKDDGYDIADYTQIHPAYGKLQDFRDFLDAAHLRGMRVITELVLNHTSDQHPWFQRARRAKPGTRERDFYVWSDTPEKYKEARIIFKDFETSNWSWDPLAKAYYWHRFYSHQPDLNFDNPAVWEALFPVVDFWMGLGVDGMRLDAVPYLFEREGTSCENLPETHEFLKALRKHLDDKFPNRMLLSEANQWPEDAVAYFGNGDETHMAFHFPLMPRLFMSVHMEDRYPILDIMAQTPTIPENCQWTIFLRNHDELTLEMVTDEERDYMYRAYASDPRAKINLGIRRRLAPLLGNDRRRIELMNALLFSMPGTPVLYYGDEIGMGDNIYLGDRNGVRTPMQWSADRNAGFSRANPQKLYLPIIIDPEYHYEAINVEAQQNNPNSLLWWMKRLMALRKRYKAFSRGTLEFLHSPNHRVLAFVRRYQEETILVVANLSRFVQHAELDLSTWQGFTPKELFGGTPLPAIGKQNYSLTLGPHSFYWFVLRPHQESLPAELLAAHEAQLPILTMPGNWDEAVRYAFRDRLVTLLPSYLEQTSWMRGKRRITAASLRDAFRVKYGESHAYICILAVEYEEGSAELFLLPLTFAQAEAAQQILETKAHAVLARFRGAQEGILYDALEQPDFSWAVLEAILAGKSYQVGNGELTTSYFGASQTPGQSTPGPEEKVLVPILLPRTEQTNASTQFGDRWVLKFFRKIEEGIHPEVELGRFLTQKSQPPLTAPLLGTVEYQGRRGEPVTLAVLHGFVSNEGTAWQYTLDELSRYFERALTLTGPEATPPEPAEKFRDLLDCEIPPLVPERIGSFLDSARMLGRRTAELHITLASDFDNPALSPEMMTPMYQRSVYQSLRNVLRRTLDRLRLQLSDLPPPVQKEAQEVLQNSDEFLRRYRIFLERKGWGQRIRLHGDFNLAEILYTGKDFVVIDFEGDVGRSLGDRRTKRSPLRDVACMVRSFHYAVLVAMYSEGNGRGRAPGVLRPEDVVRLEPWARSWFAWVSAAYLRSYLEIMERTSLLPASRQETLVYLDAFLVDRALQELGQELHQRPDLVPIPLQGLTYLLRHPVSG